MTDQVSSHEIAGHENDGHEIKGQNSISFENKLHFNAVGHSFYKRQNTSHNSKVSCIVNMLKCINYYKNINLKLATGR